jgi:hypothetical protein
MELAEHPFILEFPLTDGGFWQVTNFRRRQTHRSLTLLLNLLLNCRVNLLDRQAEPAWVLLQRPDGIEFVCSPRSFVVNFGEVISDNPREPVSAALQEADPLEYYDLARWRGPTLCVPKDLDERIALYLSLGEPERDRLDRGLFWLDMAHRQFGQSISASFASLVTSIEAFLDRGQRHVVECKDCGGRKVEHYTPSIGESFKAFLARFAPGTALQASRSKMYKVRSKILHGDNLMLLDQGRAHGWDPPWWGELQLHRELSSLTRVAFRNWLASRAAV